MAGTLHYQGKKLNLLLESIPLPDGGSVVKEIVTHPGAAVILPLVERDRVCLVENYRHALGRTLLELPAGTLNPGEAPETAAARELEEETGYRAGRFRKIAQFYPSPGFLTELMHLYVAEDLRPGTMRLDPGEQIKPVVMAYAEALRMAVSGAIEDGKTLVGLLLWDRLREQDQYQSV